MDIRTWNASYRGFLEPEHPHSYYNYIKNVLGKTPEDYGYHMPHLNKEQREILDSISTESLQAEIRRREKAEWGKEMYG